MPLKYSILSTIKKVDVYGQGIEFNINRERKASSLLGTTLTIFTFIAVLLFSVNKFKILLSFEDTIYNETLETQDDILSIMNQTDTNLNVAFTIADSLIWAPHEINITGYVEWRVEYWDWEPIYDENGIPIGTDLV